MNYSDFQSQQQAIAAQWLADHSAEIPSCEEQSYAERQGYEVAMAEPDHDTLLDSIIDEIAEEESQESDTWDFEDDGSMSVYELGGMFNVIPLAHWQAKRIKSEYQSQNIPVELDSTVIAYRDKSGPLSKRITLTQEGYTGSMSVVTGGELSGSRFNADKYNKHEALALKKRARHNIEYCYDSHGHVVKPATAQARLAPEGKKEAKKAKIMNRLAKLERSASARK